MKRKNAGVLAPGEKGKKTRGWKGNKVENSTDDPVFLGILGSIPTRFLYRCQAGCSTLRQKQPATAPYSNQRAEMVGNSLINRSV